MSSPMITKPKICCSYCSKPFAMSSLSPGAKRFCSAECASASLRIKEEPTSINSFSNFRTVVRKPPPTANFHAPTPTGMKLPLNKVLLDDQDSSRSSMADDVRPGSSISNNNAEYKPPKKKKKKGEEDLFDWIELLADPEFKSASVFQIRHAPLSRMWENVTVGMKLEVENKDVDYRIAETAFWVASVIRIHGYFVLLRYEGFGNDTSGDFWMHLCSESVHHVGWCANKGKPLIPPKCIAKKFSDWRNFLVNRLTGARTLPQNFRVKLDNGLKSQNRVGDILEVVDKNQISQLKVATVQKVVGRRLHVEYWDNTEDGGFWCHEESRLIHPEGWAKTIGHKISCPPEYSPDPLPSTAYDADYESMNLCVGMKMEAIDPLNLSAICAATIKKVLRRGYVMVRIDCYDEDASGFDWFCYHVSSQAVFPCGFCATNGVVLTPPNGYEKATFNWDDYFRATNTLPAPIKPKEKIVNHKFKEGMKIEAADLMDPRLICVATISRVVGRLLKIHFDGWEEEYDQWMDARSPDIYPIGWCDLVKHRLEPPRPPQPIPRQQAGKKKAGKGKRKGGKGVAIKKVETKPKLDSSPETKPIPQLKAFNEFDKPQSIKVVPHTVGHSMNDSVTITTVTKSKQNSSGPSFNGNSEKLNLMPPNLSKAIAANANNDVKSNVSNPSNTDPNMWDVGDVSKFLKSHDCGTYCDFFEKNEIDGKKLLALSKDQIVPLTGMKVGPAVKIFELISQLKKSTSAAKARNSALLK